jgi:signal transduction histidine kinase
LVGAGTEAFFFRKPRRGAYRLRDCYRAPHFLDTDTLIRILAIPVGERPAYLCRQISTEDLIVRIVVTPPGQNSARIDPIDPFVNYLHVVREEERIELARKLHDELGALLVSAAIDLGWAESQSDSIDVRPRLRRLGANLADAIDMKRRIIEQLRPSLLDNFGLCEALRWYFKHGCRHANASCSDTYPDQEVGLAASTLSHVFRATQTLLDCTFTEEHVCSVDLHVSVQDCKLSITLAHEHVGQETVDVLGRFPHQLKSAAYRAGACGGELSFESHARGLVFYLKLPVNETRAG